MGWQDRHYSRESDRSYTERPGSLSGTRVYLFRAMGIPVRVDISMWLMIAWIIVSGMQGLDLKGRAIGAAILFLSVLLHEFGHCIAARRVGGSASEIVLGPLGGLAMVNTPQRPWAVFASTAGGPAVNALLCVATGTAIWLGWHVVPPLGPFGGYIPSRLYHSDIAFYLWWVCMVNRLLLYFNLLPILPMDGGRILHSLLWRWLGTAQAWHITAWVGVFGAVVVTAGLLIKDRDLDPLLAYIMLSSVFFCAQQISRYRSAGADATAMGLREDEPSADTARSRRAGWFSRWRSSRAQRAREREEQRIDEILAKVSAQGMESLTRQERRFLEEATKRRQTAEMT